LHAVAAWVIWAVAVHALVHALELPLWYLWRPYVVYRGRQLRPNGPAPAADAAPHRRPLLKGGCEHGAQHSGTTNQMRVRARKALK
jgi:hypothetical protein